MISENDAKEKLENILQDYTYGIIKCVFIALNSLLSQCNSFEDFKIGVRQTVDNLNKKEDENEN